MNPSFEKLRFFLLARLESGAFWISQGLTLPARLAYTFAKPNPRQMGYDDLLAWRARYPALASGGLPPMQQHQSKWAKRVENVARLFGSRILLEVGCGYGLAAASLQKAGFEVQANDIVDILLPEVTETGVKFLPGDVCQGLEFPSDFFDLAFSINSFEHFHQPTAALDEMLRVTRPGGYIYLTFDPLYYSPWGLHANRRLGMPYPQILFGEETIQRFVDERAAEIASTYDPASYKTKIGPPLNGWSVEQFRQVFRDRRSRLKILTYTERRAYDGLSVILRNAGLFKARSPSFDSLIVSGIKLLGRKM